MEPFKAESMKDKMKRDSMVDSEDDEAMGGGAAERKRAAKKGSGGGSTMKSCQADMCAADLSDAKTYHRRHKVCEHHAKAQVVMLTGIGQRFCQQCSRFHELSEFDDAKRSCRRRLAGHNERRRKNPVDSSLADSSSGSRIKGGTQLKDMVCGRADDRGRIQMSVQDNASYKQFHRTAESFTRPRPSRSSIIYNNYIKKSARSVGIHSTIPSPGDAQR